MKKLILLLALIIALSNTLFSQWESCNNGLWGGSISSIALKGDTIFVGTGGNGVYMSSDKGENWIPKNKGITNEIIYNIIISRDNIVIETMYNIYFSTDSGDKWISIEQSEVDPIVSYGDNIYGCWRDGIILSKDNGLTWTQIKSGIPNSTIVFSIAVKDNLIMLGTINGIYINSDTSNSWTKINDDLTNHRIYSIVQSGNNFYASSFGKGIIYSTDNGQTWISKSNGLKDSANYQLSLNGNDIFALSFDGYLYLTSDKGDNWIQRKTDIGSIFAKGQNLYAGGNRGLFISMDYGNSWTHKNKGISNIDVLSIATNDNYIFAGTSSDGLFYSTDFGNNWSKKDSNFSNNQISSISINGNLICVGTNGVYLSSDNGKSWSETDSVLSNESISTLLIEGNDIIAGVFKDGVYISTDLGNSWSKKSSGLGNDDVNSFVMFVDTILCSLNNTGGIYMSTNFGDNWISKNQNLPSKYVSTLLKYNNTIYAGMEDGVYYTDDFGNNWIFKGNGIPRFLGVYSLINKNNNFFAAAGIDGMFSVYISTNNGVSWTQKNEGITDSWIRSLAINNNYVYAGTLRSGVFRAKLSDFGITSVEEPKKVINNLKISPNPAYDWLYISGIDDIYEKVINIYSILGEKVWTGMADSKEMKINIESFPAGVYFLRIGNETRMFVKE